MIDLFFCFRNEPPAWNSGDDFALGYFYLYRAKHFKVRPFIAFVCQR